MIHTEKIWSGTFWVLDLDYRLLHIRLVMWLSVGLLCTDMQCLRNRPWEFWLIYSKSWTTSKILSCSLVLNAPFVCSPLQGEEVWLPRMLLRILEICLDWEKAEHTAAPSKMFWAATAICFYMCFAFFFFNLKCIFCTISSTPITMCTLRNLNTHYTIYFSPLIYWSLFYPHLFNHSRFKTFKRFRAYASCRLAGKSKSPKAILFLFLLNSLTSPLTRWHQSCGEAP